MASQGYVLRIRYVYLCYIILNNLKARDVTDVEDAEIQG
jgi:hypothetical protein